MKMLISLVVLSISFSFSSTYASQKTVARTLEEVVIEDTAGRPVERINIAAHEQANAEPAEKRWTLLKKRFYEAAERGNIVYATLLLEELLLGEKILSLINHQDSNPLLRSPLMAAALGGHVEMCQFLIARGALTGLLNIGKMTAFELARIHGREAVCNLFKTLEESQDTTRFSRYARTYWWAGLPLGLVVLLYYLRRK